MKKLGEAKESIKKDIIVENLMISNGVYLLVARPKVGKSFFAQQLTYSLTTGKDFLGLKVNPSHVLYITTESEQKNEDFQIFHQKIKKISLVIVNATFIFIIVALTSTN